MRAMTGVRTNQPSSSLTPSSHHMLHNFVPYLAILSLPLSILSYPSSFLSLSSSLLSLSLFHFIVSLPPPGITLVDETSPVDEPSTSDQVTEGVKFAYTLPQQQSNQEDSQDDTALVCVHPCACVSVCVCTCKYIWVCTYLSIHCREYGVYI